ADTNGYEKDRPRSIWAWRDWVIDAINRDMPFDRFTIEQLAGDLLPEATVQQKIATGFHRNTMLNEEGGIDPLEFRYHAMADRVGTTGSTWLGLTLACAQCHTHKYDPITHTEYFQIMAFMNNTEEPDMPLPDAAKDEQTRKNRAEADRLLGELASQWPKDKPMAEAFDRWLEGMKQKSAGWTSITPTKMTSNLPILSREENHTIYVSGDSTKQDVYELTFEPEAEVITALRLEALPDPRLPDHGPGMTFYEGRKGDFFLNEFQVSVNGKPARFKDARHSYAKNKFGKPVSARLAADGDKQTGWSVAGRIGERHVAVFILDEPIRHRETLTVRMTFGRHYSSSLGKFRISITGDEKEVHALETESEVEALIHRVDWNEEERVMLNRAFLMQAPELKKPADRIRSLRKPVVYPFTLVMQERPAEHTRPTHRHHRGEFLQPQETVGPGTPEVLHPFPGDQPKNRLGFARWLVARNNPLTARVTVNRQWAAFFGKGLVRTLSDFGMQG
ncbi:MAG: DUF1549 domain-containing protein, partial [Verrucomicrobiota bacterium]